VNTDNEEGKNSERDGLNILRKRRVERSETSELNRSEGVT